MADAIPSAIPEPYRPPPVAERVLRRKVRKGTHSCWDCKRRKIKCTFASQTDDSCNGCRRRGTPCIGQEFPQRITENVGDRLGRVEALVDQLISNSVGSPSTSLAIGRPSSHAVSIDQEVIPGINILPKPLPRPGSNIVVPDRQLTREDVVAGSLRAAWPSENDMNHILSASIDVKNCFHGSICTPISGIRKMPSPREMLQLPPPGSHPVIIARKLLILGSYLQAMLPSDIQRLLDEGIEVSDIMSRLVDTAHCLVNSNDEVIDSVDGIECIMMESMYHNNAGNFRQAWLTMRRAMLIAQMMGLNKSRAQSSLKMLDGRTGVNPERIWLGIVTSDRYLSLMLGLPQGSPDAISVDSTNSLEGSTPEECLQRIHCAVGGRIIQRSESDINDLGVTKELDTLLRTASMSMSPRWWLMPDLSVKGCRIEDLREIERLMAQFAHFHLVARLHLPYLLRSFVGSNFEHCRITAIDASREILTRFVAFRSSHPTGAYCRGIDFLAFIACTTVCLAHIDVHRQSQTSISADESAFFVSSLMHRRPGDRGTMERALSSIEHMAKGGSDAISSKIATVLGHLLGIEADAARGNGYHAVSTTAVDEGDYTGQLSEDGNTLLINIPCLGMIKIQRNGISGCIPPDELSILRTACPSPLEGDQSRNLRHSPRAFDCPTSYSSEPMDASLGQGTDDWSLQGVDTALFDSLIRGSELII